MIRKIKEKQLASIAAGLLILTAIAYAGVRNHEFINFDDDIYVTENSMVGKGLTYKGLAWALGFNERGYWQPLTWLSHMLDCELFGLDPAGHHLANLVLHLANSLLLFWALYRMTDSVYRCAFIAAVFALHPLNVDSIAWVAERKNLLSTFFWMLSLIAYTRYAEYPRLNRYLMTLTLFALGLMAKPMLVTLPFVFLLLDYWPLARLSIGQRPDLQRTGPIPVNAIGLIIEKIPFFVLSIVSVSLSILSTRHIDNMISAETVPMSMRIDNALVSYLNYIKKMFQPTDLAVFYPYPEFIPGWQVAAAGVLLTLVTALCLWMIKRKAFLAVGWFWYLGTLVPVIGIVQGGMWPELADRWAYVPLIGLFMMIAWLVPVPFSRGRLGRAVLTAAALAVIASLFFATQRQVTHWRSSRTLFEHALKVTPPNFVTHNNLGNALLDQGEVEAALSHFRAAAKLEPQKSSVHNNLGNALMKLERVDEAIASYARSIKLNPGKAKTHNNLAVALNQRDQLTESIQHLQTALRLEPDYADAYSNLGAAYRQKGEIKKAAKSYLRAIQLNPHFPQAYHNLGLLLRQEGQLDPAINYFRLALKQDPEFTAARDNLKTALAARDTYRNALHQLREELDRSPDDAGLYSKLGDLYKHHGKLNKALAQYQQALRIRPNYYHARYQSAVIYAMQGNYDKALGLLKRLAAIQPDHIEIYYYIAGIYARQNDVNNSIDWLKKAIARGYNNWERLKRDRNFNNISGTSDFNRLLEMR